MNIENSMCYDITTDNFDLEQNTFKIEKYNSKIMFSNDFVVMSKKKINWFNRLMYKLFFGIKVERIKNE